MMLLFAEALDAAGGAGWAGAGLLGLVLGWLLLKHLPAKDAQIKDFIDGHRAHVQIIVNDMNTKARDDRAEWKSSLEMVVAHCDKEMTMIADRMSKEFSTMHASLERIHTR